LFLKKNKAHKNSKNKDLTWSVCALKTAATFGSNIVKGAKVCKM